MKYEKIFTSIISGLLVLIVFVVSLSLAVPVNILENWHIKTDQTTYPARGTIQLNSTSTKVRRSQGVVNRVVECNSGKDATIQYPLNSSEAKSSTGHHSTVYALKLPGNIVNLPATCRVVISVDYTVFGGLRHITESTVSNNFVVH